MTGNCSAAHSNSHRRISEKGNDTGARLRANGHQIVFPFFDRLIDYAKQLSEFRLLQAPVDAAVGAFFFRGAGARGGRPKSFGSGSKGRRSFNSRFVRLLG